MKSGDNEVWRPKLPRGNSDGRIAVLIAVGLPGLFLITQGVPIIETAVAAALIGAVLLIVHS